MMHESDTSHDSTDQEMSIVDDHENGTTKESINENIKNKELSLSLTHLKSVFIDSSLIFHSTSIFYIGALR